MADPAELTRKKVADVLDADNWPHMLLSEKIDAILASPDGQIDAVRNKLTEVRKKIVTREATPAES